MQKAVFEYADARDVRAWLADGREIALIDVRELGQYGAGHPFFAVPIPYSTFEPRLERLVPNKAVRLVLLDQADGVAERAAARAFELGYTSIHVMRGGAKGWAAAGFTLFEGVNVPSKAFGELLEARRHTPSISAAELNRRLKANDDLVVLDGRPVEEYRRMSIPGARCCPNGELALRVRAMVPDAATTIVVNCAGRTRSILGAQTLIDIGIPNPVLALRNGTQGWFLEGLDLDRGASAVYPELSVLDTPGFFQQRASAIATKAGVRTVDAEDLECMLADPVRTTFVLDVRTAEEHRGDGIEGLTHAPGGQLIQATDQWIGVRGARVVLVDDEMVRARVTASWLRQLGHQAYVLRGGVSRLRDSHVSLRRSAASAERPPAIGPAELRDPSAFTLIDVRSSMSYRKAHLAGALWSIRPRVDRMEIDSNRAVVLVGNDDDVVSLFARELEYFGVTAPVRAFGGDVAQWKDAGLGIEENGTSPGDDECIDFIFHTHDRHSGNAAAARAYLEWETGLIGRLDEQELGVFRITPLKGE